jgi:hypothetical protein
MCGRHPNTLQAHEEVAQSSYQNFLPPTTLVALVHHPISRNAVCLGRAAVPSVSHFGAVEPYPTIHTILQNHKLRLVPLGPSILNTKSTAAQAAVRR